MVSGMPISRVRRRGERGAAVLVVLLVIIMLTGIGVFATRAASLGTLSSGFDRQMTQTHYITEYAIVTAAAELSVRGPAYFDAMNDPKKTLAEKLLCSSIVDTSQTPPAIILGAQCYQFSYAGIQSQLAGSSTNVLIMPFVPGSPATGGGLGFAPIQGDFNVDMTDQGPATPPIAGMDPSPTSPVNVQYKAVTLTATGFVRPSAPTNTVDSAVGQSTSTEISRAHVVVLIPRKK
jgi:hypothetical protein